jgi:undecaprenyl-diphosphatase
LLFPSLLFETKDLGLVFDIAVHAGTLAAVIFYFKDDILKLLQAWMPWTSNRNESDFLLGLNLIIASMPIVFVGLIFSDLISARLHSIDSIAWANLIFAGLLFAAFKMSSQNKNILGQTLGMALFIGCLQALAVFPGASRSGMAITGALLVGLNLKDSSKFAFLLSIPTILGAIVLMLAKEAYVLSFDDLMILLTGFISSAVIAFFTIRIFLQFVEQIGMTPFVVYRILLGVVLLLVW